MKTNSVPETIAAIPADSPSMLSSRLKALVTPTIQKIINGTISTDHGRYRAIGRLATRMQAATI